MADAAFIQLLNGVQTRKYFTAIVGAVVVYDHVLTFPQEVDFIWNRKWSYMTGLYLIARYSGSLGVIGTAVWNLYINWTYLGYVDMFMLTNWANNIYLLSMQAILVIRVYAFFNQSRKMLIFLAAFFALQSIFVLVITGLSINMRVAREYVTAISPPIGSVTQFQGTQASTVEILNIAQYSTIVSVVFDAVLLFLALWAFVKHILEEKKADGGWSINVLLRTLLADHVIYFICNLTWLSLCLQTDFTTTDESLRYNDALYVFYASAFVAGPRMVISLRTIENKTRGEGGTLGDVSTIWFGVPEPPTQSESVIEQGAPSSG